MPEHSTHASKDSLEAMKQNDRHGTGTSGSQDAVPGEDSAHAHSVAAHLQGGKAHTKAAGDLRELENKEESNRDNGRATETYRNA